MINQTIPQTTFKTRVRDEAIGGDNPYRWQEMSTTDYFAGKKVIVFSLPGALRRLVRPFNCQILSAFTRNSAPLALTRFTAFRSMMPL